MSISYIYMSRSVDLEGTRLKSEMISKVHPLYTCVCGGLGLNPAPGVHYVAPHTDGRVVDPHIQPAMCVNHVGHRTRHVRGYGRVALHTGLTGLVLDLGYYGTMLCWIMCRACYSHAFSNAICMATVMVTVVTTVLYAHC